MSHLASSLDKWDVEKRGFNKAMNSPKIVAIVLNWNGFEDTMQCIESLQDIHYPDLSVILFDNGSDDAYKLDALEQKYGDFVTILKSKKNLGFSVGFNLALKYVLECLDFDFILRLDNDTVVHPDCVNALLDAMQDGKVGASVSLVYDSKNKSSLQQVPFTKLNFYIGDITGVRGISRFLGEGLSRVFGIIPKVEYQYPTDTSQIGWCTLIRKECVEKVGFFDESYFFTWEAVDYSERIKKSGYRIVCVPNAVIWHKWRTAGVCDGKTEYYNPRNRFKFMKRYATKAQYASFIMYFFIVHFGLAVFYYIMMLKRVDILRKWLSGVCDGLLGRY